MVAHLPRRSSYWAEAGVRVGKYVNSRPVCTLSSGNFDTNNQQPTAYQSFGIWRNLVPEHPEGGGGGGGLEWAETGFPCV